MKILLLGSGLQGRAALYDLAHSQDVTRVVVADDDIHHLSIAAKGLSTNKVTTVQLNARDHGKVASLMRSVQAVVVLLPPEFGVPIANLAVSHRIHYIDAYFTAAEHRELGVEAASRDIAILTEFGLDPGIDLMLAGKAAKELDEVHQLDIYGAGIPDAEAANNPLSYKLSWTLAGVLKGYRDRPTRVVRDGNPVDIPSEAIFSTENVTTVEIPGVGELEAFPNEDITRTLRQLGIAEKVHTAGRYSMRWPGHCAFWDKLVNLGFLEQAPIQTGRHSISPRQFVHDLLHPQLQYEEYERDLAIVRIDAHGTKDGHETRIIYDLLDSRDQDTGLLAMQRTVGFTTSIGAQMIIRGDIQKRGLLSPARDIPTNTFFSELNDRGIEVRRKAVRAAPR